jgi:hypothetical protein
MTVYYQINNTRDFHILIEEIALYLKDKYNAALQVINNEHVIINKHTVFVADCDLLIYYPDKDSFKGITFADRQNDLTGFFIRRNNLNDIILNSQYGNTVLINHKESNYQFKNPGSIYTPSSPCIDYEQYYNKRQLNTDYIDKFIFRGNVHGAARGSVDLLKEYEYFKGYESINLFEYFDELSIFKIGLSVPGVGELCYRDVEYMAIGIPMMRFEYITQLNPPLIPNYHYIAIDRIDTEEHKNYNGGPIAAEREGGQEYVNQYLKKFEEIKDDKKFLSFIANNAKEYYNTYLHPSTRLQHIIKLLEIE